jgi:tetratricopeptide (TPR) repeat protein
VISILRSCALPLVLVVCTALSPVARSESPEEAFDRGNAAYERESYDEAVEAYQAVLRYGIEDARLEYNLGNAAFKLGRLGHAILHFERARRLAPTDLDVLANLEYARTFCFDPAIPDERAALVRLLEGWQDRLGPDRQAWALLAVFWIFAALMGWGFSRRGRFSASIGWSLSALIVTGLILVASWYTTHQRLEGNRTAVILDEVVEVLAGPGQNNPTLFTVHEGLTVAVRGERDEWIQVHLPNGLNGWLSRDSAGLIR